MTDDVKATGYGARPPFYKRQYIVDKPFQYRLIGTFMAIWAANSVFFTLVLYFLYDSHLTQFYELVPREGMMPLLSLPALFVTSVVFIAAFGVVVLAIIAMYMSNQIAGPLWRTKKSLDRISKGDLAFELRFRQGDFLKDLPGIFNGMVASLKKQTTAELEALEAIEAAAGDPGEVLARVKRLREKKQAQLGLSGEASETGGEEHEVISVAVH
jgi:methyl-accepting chemotaxis protein